MDLFESIAHLILPRQSNNHRARVFHPGFLTYIIIGVLSLQLAFPLLQRARPDILGFATNIHIDKLLTDTNNERVKQGLNPLTLNSTLSNAAQKKAADMFTDNYWAHVSPDGTTPWDFINGEGYSYTYAGENLARDFNDSDAVVTAWMNSPSHRDNLLRGEYEDIGFAVVNGKLNGEDTTLVVQMFGTKRPSYTARETAPQIPQVAKSTVSVTPQVSAVPSPTVFVPTVTVMPTATIAPTFAPVAIAAVEGSSEKPLINQKTFERGMSIGITAILLFILFLDGYFIWRHKVVRIAGHNLAHFIFLFALLSIIIIGTSGAIL